MQAFSPDPLPSVWPEPAQVLFFDPGLADVDRLLAGLSPQVTAIALDPNQDAIDQITTSLADRHNLSAIHLLTHGQAGAIAWPGRETTTELTADRLTDYTPQLSQWRSHLAAGADLLIYGCDVAARPEDSQLLAGLAALTGADVAASDDLTGRGGDWDLEVATGAIESRLPFDLSAAQAFTGTLATINVTMTGDAVTADGQVSLREAVGAINNGADFGDTTNSSPDPYGTNDTIILGAGLYSLGGTSLSITDEVTIQGAGAARTTIQQTGIDRVLNITVNVSLGLSDLTISGGRTTSTFPAPSSGGGIFSLGPVTLNNTTVSGNSAGTIGGGIYSNVAVTLNNSTVTGNQTTISGAGVFSFGPITVNNSTVSGNSAGNNAGGLNAASTIRLNNSTVNGNTAGQSGGGIVGPTVNLNSSTVSGNRASISDGGGIVSPGTIAIMNSTVSGNSAGGRGGGVVNTGAIGSITLTNSTIGFNTASVQGGGLYHFFPIATTIRNSIIAKNSNGVSPDLGGDFTGASFSHNLIGSNTGFILPIDATNQVNVDPLLGPLANNGGPTLTHALTIGSPATDKGNNAFSPGSTDQRGQTRIINGTIDLGAVEVQPPTVVVPPTVPSPVILVPDIQVQDAAGVNVPLASSPPIAFGTTRLGELIDRSFLVRNVGDGPLNLRDLTLPAGFGLVSPTLPQVLSPQAQVNLVVRLLATDVGSSTGLAIITNDDPDEAPYFFSLTGEVLPALAPLLSLNFLAPTLSRRWLEPPSRIVQLEPGRAIAYGSEQPEQVIGAAGPEVLLGLAGADWLLGGAGNDYLYGNQGNDLLAGDQGNDVLDGGSGNDDLLGGLGDDRLWGRSGDDWLAGDEGDDRLWGDAGNDSLDGGDGADELAGGPGQDLVLGGQGNDGLVGGPDNDTLFGQAGDDRLAGDDGDDAIAGGRGNDQLNGGAGADSLDGGAGVDLLDGGAGPDVLQGGLGADQFVLAAGAGPDLVLDFTPGDDRFWLLGGLTFADLSLADNALGQTEISIAATGEILARLQRSIALTSEDFQVPAAA